METKSSALNNKSTNNPNSFSNIIFNIFIPVLILNKGSKYGLSPITSLVIALSFPLFFGLYSLIKDKQMNYIALLGLANILFSGILTVLSLDGIWFAVKEAAFPLLIGVFVFASSYTASPFFKSMFMNPAAFDTAKIQEQLNTPEKETQFNDLMKRSTQWLSGSFLLSAVLNFVLAITIFKPVSEALAEIEKQELLNQQLSQMTMYSMVVILIPTVIFVGLILYFAFKKTTAITNLKMEDIFLK